MRTAANPRRQRGADDGSGRRAPRLRSDKAIYGFFRQHFADFFPAITRVYRTTFLRRAADLWKPKDLLWHQRVGQKHADLVSLVDRAPIPVRAFTRTHWCRTLGDKATCEREPSILKTFYGFRLRVRSDRSGRIEAISATSLAGADQSHQ